MATRKQSDPRHALGDLFAGPNDRTPAPLPKLPQIPGTPGMWSYADRQAYVDSRPGSAMWEQNGSHGHALAMQRLKEINEAEAAKRRQAEEDRRKRY